MKIKKTETWRYSAVTATGIVFILVVLLVLFIVRQNGDASQQSSDNNISFEITPGFHVSDDAAFSEAISVTASETLNCTDPNLALTFKIDDGIVRQVKTVSNISLTDYTPEEEAIQVNKKIQSYEDECGSGCVYAYNYEQADSLSLSSYLNEAASTKLIGKIDSTHNSVTILNELKSAYEEKGYYCE